MGLVPALPAVVGPSTTTWAAEACSTSVKNRPSTRLRARTSGQPTVVPVTCEDQLSVPYWTLTREPITGATPAMSGATAGSDSTSASSRVSDIAPDAEPCPALDRDPGITMSRLLPSLLISAVIWCRAPSPRPTVSMTAAMPMRMPSIVSSERIRRPSSASTAVRNVSDQLTTAPPCPPTAGRR